MNINPNLSAIQNVLMLINEANDLDIQPGQVSLGTPTAITADAQGRNTELVLTAIHNAGFSGTKTVRYKRQAANAAAKPVVNTLSMRGEFTDTVEILKARYLSLLGLVDEPTHGWNAGRAVTPPTVSNPITNITFRAGADSLLYTPSSSPVRLNIIPSEFSFDNLTDFLADTSNWIRDPDRGWYNNVLEYSTEITLSLTTGQAAILQYMDSIEGVFTGYNDNPSGGIGSNLFFAGDTSAATHIVGTQDGNTDAAAGQTLYYNGTSVVTTADAVNQTYNTSIPAGRTVNNLYVKSGHYQTYPYTLRGMKDMKIKLKTQG